MKPALILAALLVGSAQAASFKLNFVGGLDQTTGVACGTATTACVYRNVVFDQVANAALPSTSLYQRDVIVTRVALVNATINDFDDDTNGTPVGNNSQFFSPVVSRFNQNNGTQANGYAQFRFTFYAAGAATPTTVTALDGGVFVTALDTDGNIPGAFGLREFVTLFSPTNDAGGTSVASITPVIPVAGTKTYRNTSDSVGAGISLADNFKVSIFQASPSSFDYVVGSTFLGNAPNQTCASNTITCNRLGALSFDRLDALPLVANVNAYKSAKLTTDADGSGSGNISPGDTVTYTVTYVNTGNVDVTGFQIVDALPTGLTAAAGAQTVRVNGTVTATAKNALYTGVAGATANLLSAGQTLAGGGTISVDIPATVGATVADNTTLVNQTTATVGAGSVSSDNVDNTTVFPPSISSATGFGTVPALSVAQTQGTAIDKTSLVVRVLPKLTLIKTVAGRVNATDQFTVQIKNGATVTSSATTTGTGTSATTGAVNLANGTTYTLTEIGAGTPAATLTNYVSSLTCTNATTGSTTTLLSGAGQSFSLTPQFGDVITCTLTNTPKPTLTVRKISNGGVGAFSFSGTNGFANQTITTTVAGTAVSGATQVLSAASTATTITEVIPSGYVLASVSCTGMGTSGTVAFTPGTNNFTLNAAATAAGSVIVCTVTNTKSPIISLQKAFGGTGRVVATDQFRLAIGGTNLVTTGTGSAVTSAAASLNPAVTGTAYTLSETGAGTPAANLGNYTTTYACTNTLTGGQTPSGSAASFSVTPVAGDVLSCTFTNTPVPVLADVSISKTGPASLVVGEVGSYTLKVWNQGPSPVTGATIADAVPAGLSGVSWTCAASGLATCGTASGTGNAISFASGLLPVNTTTGAAGATNPAPTSGDYLTITVTGTATTAGDLTNTASVTAPGGVTDGFGANNTASQATRIVPLPFTPTTPAVCSTLPGFTGIGPNLVTAFNDGTFGTSTGDPLVAGSIVRSPTGWAYLAANIPNYGYVQVGGSQPIDGALSLVSRMSDPRVFGVWSNTLTPITVNAAGAATSDVTSGRFLLINGSNQGQSIIETTIPVTPNTNYQLTGIFANVIDSGGNQVLPDLNFNIGGASYYKTGPIPQDNNGNAPTSANQAKWRQVGFVFNSGAATSVSFAMVSNVPAANGNDFAFDQLGLNQCQGTYVNTLGGFLYGDNNGNASFQNPAEPQLPAGVKVSLQYTDPNGNPVTVARTTTGVGADTGRYVFTNVPPPPTGFSYFVHVEDGTVVGEPTTIPAGYTQSTPNNAALPGTPNYVSGTNTGPDFGFALPTQPPAVTLLKLGRNVTKGTAFIAGTGSIGVLPGDVVEYCLVYSNTGGAAPDFRITDNVPAGVDAQLSAYAAGRGIRWATGVTVPVGDTNGTPLGVNLTSASADDQGTLTTTGGTNGKGVMAFNLGAAGLAAGGNGTVCFQTKVP